jgi:hypothetical protein
MIIFSFSGSLFFFVNEDSMSCWKKIAWILQKLENISW